LCDAADGESERGFHVCDVVMLVKKTGGVLEGH
jgi:hypothetical protein